MLGFKRREGEIREQTMLRIRLLRHTRSRSTVSVGRRLSRGLTISSSGASASESAAMSGWAAVTSGRMSAWGRMR